MKIALVVSRFPPSVGGGETLTYELAVKLTQLGHTVTVVTNACQERKHHKYNFKIIEIEGFEQEKLDLNKSLPALYHTFKTLDVDIVHVFNYLPLILLQQVINTRHRFKIVFTVYTTPIMNKRVFGAFDDYKAELFFAQKIFNSKQYSLLINLSKYYQSCLNAFAGKKLKNVLIPCGVDLDLFNTKVKSNIRKRYSINPSNKLILCTSRFIPRKGLQFLIEALKYLDPTYKLFLSGSAKPADKKTFNSLMRLIKKYHLQKRIILSNKVFDYEEMPMLYRASDVFVIPSEFEGFGMVSVEAMACGVPVVGTNVPGVNEAITKNHNGILVPFANAKAIADAVKNVLSDDVLRNKLIKNGLNTVKKLYSLEHFILKHEIQYKKLLKKRYRQSRPLKLRRIDISEKAYLDYVN